MLTCCLLCVRYNSLLKTIPSLDVNTMLTDKALFDDTLMEMGHSSQINTRELLEI